MGNRGRFPGSLLAVSGRGFAGEAGQGRDFRPGDSEARSDEVVEGDFELHAGFGEAKHDVTCVAASVADGSAGDFSFGDEGTDVVFRRVGVEWNFRPFENAQQFVLTVEQASQQAVEHGVARFAFEDSIEPVAQGLRLLRAGRQLVFLQATIEPPDHSPGDLDGVALHIVGGDQFVNEPFGVNPAQGVRADTKLSRVVGDNDGVLQQALMADRAPQRSFGGDQDGIGGDLQFAQTERVQMALPFLDGEENLSGASLSMTACDRLRPRM